MLFCEPIEDACRQHLLRQRINLLVTNVCNLSCGGCTQSCGQIHKDKLFFIDLDEMKWVIDWVLSHTMHRFLGIFGGEPTLHPKYEEMLDLLRSYRGTMMFMVYSNGRRPPYNVEENIFYCIDQKDANTDRFYVPTLVAPIDIYGNQDKKSYWELTKQNCHIWNHCACIIMHKRAYACEIFAAFDTMSDENHGWELKWGENAFDKSEDEIKEQAAHYCYRCGWCLPQDIKNKFHQKIDHPPLVTISNIDLNFKHGYNLANKEGHQ